jgi:hypothetical protein
MKFEWLPLTILEQPSKISKFVKNNDPNGMNPVVENQEEITV